MQTPRMRYRADVVLHNLGVVAQEQGDLDAARGHFQDSVAMKRALGDTAGLALSLAKLGEVLSSRGDARAAQRLLSESLTLVRDLGDRPGIAFVLERWAVAAVAQHRPLDALRFAGAGDALREAIGTPLSPAARVSLEASMARARNALRADLATSAWETGRSLPLDDVIADALKSDVEREDNAVAADAASQLSAREREVARLVALGLTNRDIAERLVVSERTAENHVQHVLNRLGLRSRAQVAAWAVHRGLTEPN
jgi:non-specific serine/threonine protein kinase